MTSESKERRPINKERIEQIYRFEYLDQSRWQLGDESGKWNTEPQPCPSDDPTFQKIVAIFKQTSATANIGTLSWPFVGKAFVAQVDQAVAEKSWHACLPLLREIGYQPFWVAGRTGLADLIEHITTYLSFDSENYLWQPRRPEFRSFADSLSELEGHWEPFFSPGKNPPVTPSPADLIALSEKIDLNSWFELACQNQKRKVKEQSTEKGGFAICGGYGKSRWSVDELALPCILIVKASHACIVPALFYFGGHDQCPPPQIHSAMLMRWHEKYSVDLYGVGRNLLELYFAGKGSQGAKEFLQEAAIYCPGSTVSISGSEVILRFEWIAAK